MRALFILFIVLPILEIFLLIQVGSVIGGLNTIAIVICTAFVGVALLRKQGESALARAQRTIREGGVPATEMVEGLFLAVGGALLLTPGFITDAIGFCCLLPGVRKVIIGWGLRQFAGHSNITVQHYSSSTHSSASHRRDSRGDTIEGDYRRED